MGDIITKVNNHTIRNPEDLTRVITISERNVVFEVEDPNRNRRLVSVEI
jgi:type II secretory pathway component PulC